METSISVKIDDKKIQEEMNRILQDKVWNVLSNRLHVLFYDSKAMGGRQHSDPDAGYMVKLIDGAITEVALDPKWVEYAKKRAEELMPSAIEESVQRTVTHKASKIAFTLSETPKKTS